MIHTHTYTGKDGFTLIEIMIVFTIIGIIGALVGPNIYRALGSSKNRSTEANLRTIKSAIDQFYLDMNDFPGKLRDLVKKPTDEKLAKKWTESYLSTSEIPADGWGASFQYKRPGEEGHPYELYSYGPNGKGAPKLEWISVWKL